MTNGHSRTDPLLAMFFSALWPGCGHLYLRLAWAGWCLILGYGALVLAGVVLALSPNPSASLGLLLTAPVLLFYKIVILGHAYVFALRSSSGEVFPPLDMKRRAAVFLGIIAALWVFNVPGLFAGYAQTRGIRVFRVSSTSMEPTLKKGGWYVLDRSAYHHHSIQRGDIIVFSQARDAERLSVKRVAGLPGEELEIRDGTLYINGSVKVLRNSRGAPIRYSGHGTLGRGRPVLVPSGQYFLLGDNSARSVDSRYSGAIPGEQVLGRVWAFR